MTPRKVLIAGGGYAGLTVCMALKSAEVTFDIVLVDPQSEHLKLTHLHKTVHKPLAQYKAKFEQLAARHGFRYIQGNIEGLDDIKEIEGLLSAGQATVRTAADVKEMDFDYMVVATGARTISLPQDRDHTVNLDELKTESARNYLDRAMARATGPNLNITVVGGGATAVQFLFEIKDYLKKSARPHHLRLVDRNQRLVEDLPVAFHEYIAKQIDKQGIEYIAQTNYVGQQGVTMELEGVDGQQSAVESDMTFLFPGVEAYPVEFVANANGLLKIKNTFNRTIFAAGDVSDFAGDGLNMKSAQAAVRKGKQVAQNIVRSATGRRLAEYKFRQLGYFISLGSMDGIGWIFSKGNVLTGLPAFVIKEAIEAQFELYLQGIDTYVI